MGEGQTAALQTALAYHRAWINRDKDAALRYVADSVICDSPNVHVEGIEAFGEYLGHLMENSKSSELQVACADEESAVLVYDLASIQGPVTPVADWTTVRDGQIVKIKLIYDRTPYFTTVESYGAFLEKVHAGAVLL